jgi:hypothetical protein
MVSGAENGDRLFDIDLHRSALHGNSFNSITRLASMPTGHKCCSQGLSSGPVSSIILLSSMLLPPQAGNGISMKQFGGRLSSGFRTVGFRVDPSTGIGDQCSNDLMTTAQRSAHSAHGPPTVRDAFCSSRRSTRIARSTSISNL